MPKPLTWINDPLLFDVEPLQVNQWLNANELIHQNRSNEIFLSDEKHMNLYPIMIRKNDFVRKKSSDRIMARLPFLVINDETKEQIQDKILLISEIIRNYFYKSINKSIMEWKQDILNYMRRGTLPFPIIRCCFELLPNLHALVNETSLRFTSARGEAFSMPTNLTKEIAYLAGMVNGDGNLRKYTLRIVDFSIENIKQLQTLFREYFDQIGNILFKTPNSPELVITNLWVVRLFSFLTSQPIGIKKYESLREPLIFQKEPLRAYYWSGLMDSDGSYKRNSPKFSSVSESFAIDFLNYLKQNKIIAVLRKGIGNTSIVYLSSESNEILKSLLVCLHPEKQKEFIALTKSPSRFKLKFIDFESEQLIDGYFNFELFKSVYVTGLTKNIRDMRGSQSLRLFAKSLEASHRTIQEIEKGKQGIEISLLTKLLSLNGQSLMPYLEEHSMFIRYKMRNTEPINLVVKPSQQLISLAENLRFFKHSIVIKNATNSKKDLMQLFDVHLTGKQVNNKLIRTFFHLFSKFEIEKNSRKAKN